MHWLGQGSVVSVLAWLRRRLNLRPSDGTICAAKRPDPCNWHRGTDWACRCLEPQLHGGNCKCGQGVNWPNHERTKT